MVINITIIILCSIITIYHCCDFFYLCCSRPLSRYSDVLMFDFSTFRFLNRSNILFVDVSPLRILDFSELDISEIFDIVCRQPNILCNSYH